jgi:hypothetical protein
LEWDRKGKVGIGFSRKRSDHGKKRTEGESLRGEKHRKHTDRNE